MDHKPIIRYLSDNDVYTFSVAYFYLNKFPRAHGRYSFVDRNNTIYPQGFAKLVRDELKAMEAISISDDEISFMSHKCYYFPTWFFTFLKGYRFDSSEVSISQNEEGHLEITVEGLLWKTVFWEVPILAIISELKHELDGHISAYKVDDESQKSLNKGLQLISNGLSFAEFGTRRRFSFMHQDMVIRTLLDANTKATSHGGEETINSLPTRDTSDSKTLRLCNNTLWHNMGRFSGTSNVYFAMKYNLSPIGTMSHQIISFCGAIFGYKEANYIAMSNWQEAFDSDLGTYLYDTFAWEAFAANFGKKFAKLFDGLRVDSGDNFEAVDLIVEKYKSLNIDPRTKHLTFSNGLNVDEAIKIHNYCQGKINDNYGIGTFLSCDVNNVKAMNIVMKLTAAKLTEKTKWHKAIKLSADKGKYTGDQDELDLALKILKIV